MSEQETIAMLAALIDGDRYLSADGCAAYLGGIKRRTFLERVAVQPDFPAPSRIAGAGRLWLKSEVHEYAKRKRVDRRAA